MAAIDNKRAFVEQCRGAATQLAQVGDKLDDLITVFFDRGYSAGGADPITDEDVALFGVTAQNVSDLITLAQNLAEFRNNGTVSKSDFDATLNRMRTDV